MSAVLILPCGPDYFEELFAPVVMEDIEARFDIRREDLRGCARSQRHVLPRHVAILALKSFGASNAAAGAAVGRDETAAPKVMNRLIGRTPKSARLRREVGALRERVFQRMNAKKERRDE